MNKVITINLNGQAYQLEEGGYDALRAYLDGAARRLEGNPDRDEIIADIEQAIGDKCRALLSAHKTVVVTKEIEQIVAEMGPVEDASGEAPRGAAGSAGGAKDSGTTGAAEPAAEPGPARRLYRIYPEGAMLSGVCNGLAAYLNLDVALVRVLFCLTCFFWGFGILLYILMVIIIPPARTSAEKSAAFGAAATAQEFIRRAKEGYYEGLKTFSDKHAHREWRRRFKDEMRNWRRTFRREMRDNAYRGHPNWAPGPGAGPGAWVMLPLVSLLHSALVFLWVCMLISLLAKGTIFGLLPPADLPVWATILILFLLFGFVSWPLKALRHACYYHASYGRSGAPPVVWLWEVMVWVAFAVALGVLASHHFPQLKDALQNLPDVVHDAVDAFRRWWSKP